MYFTEYLLRSEDCLFPHVVTCVCIDLVASVAVHFGPLQITRYVQ